jgi:hypothetical protein
MKMKPYSNSIVHGLPAELRDRVFLGKKAIGRRGRIGKNGIARMGWGD